MPKWKPGQSGNLNGRPPGVVDKRVRLRALVESHAEALVQKAIDLALKENDTAALRLLIERAIPAVRARDEPVPIALPTAGTLAEQGQAVLACLADGTLAPSEAGAVFGALLGQARIREIDDLDRRLAALEAHAVEAA